MIVSEKIDVGARSEDLLKALSQVRGFVQSASEELCDQVKQATELHHELSHASERLTHMEET